MEHGKAMATTVSRKPTSKSPRESTSLVVPSPKAKSKAIKASEPVKATTEKAKSANAKSVKVTTPPVTKALREQKDKSVGRSSRSKAVLPKPESEAMNRSLHAAKSAKHDEFYTQYADIQKEVEAYLEFDANAFRGKVVYCNCDDPFESNFFKYFAANFNKLGLKKFVTTSYDGSPIAGQGTLFPEYNKGSAKRQKPRALAVSLDHVRDEDGDGAANVTDVALFLKRNQAARTALKGDDNYPGGDFRSPECVALLKEADIVVTNPPFSLFREYVAQLIEHKKKCLIVGPKNAITYKEIFPLIKATKLWLGAGFANGNAYFSIPEDGGRDFAEGVYDANTGLVKFRNVGWFTNLDHGRRHQRLECMTTEQNLKFSKHKQLRGKAAYDRYDNYDAIEVPFTDAIPCDYGGAMGVPITFLDRYNPEQFEILGTSDNGLVDKIFKTTPGLTEQFVDDYYKCGGTGAYKEGNPTAGYYENGEAKMAYKRIFIRHKKKKKKQ